MLQFGVVVVMRRGRSGWVVRACECAESVIGILVFELVVDIVLAIHLTLNKKNGTCAL